MFKFTLTIATSVFLLMPGAADLFAMKQMNDLDDKSGKQHVIAMTKDAEPGPINHIPKEVIELIVNEIVKDTNPRLLITISKPWYSFFRENNVPQRAELHYSATNTLDTTMNPFMQQCMNTYWENLFYKGILSYTPTDGSAAVTLKFSDFKDGRFDLSKCGDTGQSLVITTSMNQFFEVREENKDKTVVGIMPCHRILQEIKNSPNHSLFPLMAHLNPDKAPVVLLWRWGNDENLAWFDYLTTASVMGISSKNLFENWSSASMGRRAVASVCPAALLHQMQTSCSFLNQNKDY